jgi:hypothetical protein
LGDRIGVALRAPLDWLQTRLAGPAGEMHQGAEMALAKKAAIVVGVGASLVAGGAAVERAVDGGSGTTRESASPAIRPAQRPVAAVQTDRASHRDAVAKRDREQRAQAAERRQREAADATNAAAARPAADAAEPLNAEPAADPADAAPADAAPTDGQAEGLAP